MLHSLDIHWFSSESLAKCEIVHLWPPSPLLTHSFIHSTNICWESFLSTHLASLLDSEQQAARPPLSVNSFVASDVRLCSCDIWLPVYSWAEPPILAPCRDGYEEPAVHGSFASRGGSGGTFLAAAKTICFGDPPCFSPARHWLPTYTFPWWNRNMHLEELTSSKTE